MKLLRFSLIASLVSIFALPNANAQGTATTDPVGFVTVNAVGGSSGAKRSTLLSLPLLEVDAVLTNGASGVISSVTSNSIVVSNAGWLPGALSQPSAPFVIQITSGAAAGNMFLVASSANTAGASGSAAFANTASNLFISPLEMTRITSLPAAGVSSGDGFKLFACDTLSSAFGVPGPNPGSSNSILGGTSAPSADNVVVTVNGTPTTYYYNTASNAWLRAAVNSAANNVALSPNYGITFNRQSTNGFSSVITGQVPVINRVASIKNSGQTVLSSFWPTTNTLNSLGLQNLPGWVIGTNQVSTDNVILTVNGTPTTFYYNGTNWRRFPLTANENNRLIPIGSAVTVVKKGSAPGYTSLNQARPYSLD